MSKELTIKDLINGWETYALSNLSFNTFKAYRKRLADLAEEIGDFPVEKLKKKDLARIFGSIQSASVREQAIAAYKSLKKFAEDFTDAELPDVPSFVKPKIKKKLPKPLEEEVFYRMLEIAEKQAREEGLLWRLAAIVLMGFAGLRKAELMSLNPFSLEERDGTVWIRVKGKGGKERAVPLPKNRWTDWLWENRQKVLPIPVSISAVNKAVEKIGKKAGNHSVTPHRLRHTYGTLLSKKGVPVQVIQELMGHSSPRTTMNYVKVAGEEKVKAVEVLAEH